MGDEARHSERDAALCSGWKQDFFFLRAQKQSIKDSSEPFPLRQETKREPEIAWKWS